MYKNTIHLIEILSQTKDLVLKEIRFRNLESYVIWDYSILDNGG